MRCVKHGLEARHQFEWWRRVSQLCTPRWYSFNSETDELYYEYVEGRTPTDWREVVTSAEEYLWHVPTSSAGLVDPAEYVSYVKSRVAILGRSERWADLPHLHLWPIFRAIEAGDYLPVEHAHGDMTFKNCVVKQHGRLVFLDPGHARSMQCREIDESKIMQSLDGFDVVYLGHPQPPVVPHFPARREHWALLATHYIRLLVHVTHEPALRFAYQRILDIAGLLDA